MAKADDLLELTKDIDIEQPTDEAVLKQPTQQMLDDILGKLRQAGYKAEKKGKELVITSKKGAGPTLVFQQATA
jgi:hypothetical protein